MKLLLILLLAAISSNSYASNRTKDEPYFAIIKASEANARTGPSTRYPIKWVYRRKGLPIQIIAKFGNWRKITDVAGAEGWIHKNLLSRKQNALTIGNDIQILYQSNDNNSRPLVKIEPNVLVAIDKCTSKWCKVTAEKYEGWIKKKYLWGIS